MPHDIWFLVAIGLYAFLSPFWSRSLTLSRPTERRIARLEEKVNLLLDKAGIAHDTPSDQVRDLILQGMKINAIKLYREQNPVGLKEAKDVVEEMEAQMNAESFR